MRAAFCHAAGSAKVVLIPVKGLERPGVRLGMAGGKLDNAQTEIFSLEEFDNLPVHQAGNTLTR